MTPSADTGQPRPQRDEAALRSALAALLTEGGRPTAPEEVDLDGHMELNLGLDSLGRAELLSRLERSLQIRLPERLLTVATPRELLHGLAEASPQVAAAGPSPIATSEPAVSVAAPIQAQTLVEVLDYHARRQAERHAILLYADGASEPQPLSYGMLRQHARHLAAGLLMRGLRPGQRVAIMLPTGVDYFAAFFGVLLAGGVPVPIYPPLRPSQLEEHLRRHARLLANAGAVLLITVPQARLLGRLLAAQVPSLTAVVSVADLDGSDSVLPALQPAASDLAFVQYSSGSTGEPKGVMLSHANLLANIRAMIERIAVRPNDVFVSWLPLYHDMGLIGACLGTLYQGIPLVLMSPLAFLHRPLDWLWAIHHHRGTLSAAPNFAFELCLRHAQQADLNGLSLSSLRYLANGAEPVSANTMRRFAERLAPYDLDPAALAPVYGLAECSVGLALPPPGRGLKVDRVWRDALSRSGEAQPALEAEADALEVVACGHALAGHQIRVVDAAGRELPERRTGRLQFRGPSTTGGYLANPEANAGLFSGDWLDSGDQGYLAAGDVYITGRDKDLIIRAGRNIYPYDLEQAIGAIEGVRKGCVAVFGSTAPGTGDQLIVAAETRYCDDPAVCDELRRSIREVAVGLLDAAPDMILLLPPQSVLKTSSGKIRRAAMRALYQQGLLGRERRRPVWWQLTRLGMISVPPLLRSGLRRFGELAYGGYAWLIGGLVAAPLWLAAVAMPARQPRWRAVHALLRLALRLARIPLAVSGLESLPVGPCVLVVNHSSYLDALLLVAALPRPFSFVAKRELANRALLRWPLARLGTLFVERFDRHRSTVDAARLSRLVQSGTSLVFFPEGTFTRMPGLLPFRMGAFTAATEAGVPLVPVTLSGTRAVLREGSWLPRLSALAVVIDQPLQPAGSGWAAATDLRQRARTTILARSGEPELATADSLFGRADAE